MQQPSTGVHLMAWIPTVQATGLWKWVLDPLEPCIIIALHCSGLVISAFSFAISITFPLSNIASVCGGILWVWALESNCLPILGNWCPCHIKQLLYWRCVTSIDTYILPEYENIYQYSVTPGISSFTIYFWSCMLSPSSFDGSNLLFAGPSHGCSFCFEVQCQETGQVRLKVQFSARRTHMQNSELIGPIKFAYKLICYIDHYF